VNARALVAQSLTTAAMMRLACGHAGQLTTSDGDDGGGAMRAPVPCPKCAPAPTVKAPDMFGTVHDTGATESALNGWVPVCNTTRTRVPQGHQLALLGGPLI
jgi:hypothetical protein